MSSSSLARADAVRVAHPVPRGAILALATALGLGGLALVAGPAQAVSPTVVISQVYGGGGNSGAPLTNDYIELFNRGDVAVDLSTWSVQYASSTGTGNFGANSTALSELSGTLGAGQYLVIREAAGSTPAGNFTSDIDDPTPIALSGSAGKVALVNSATGLGCNGGSNPCTPAQLAQIVDLVGYGSANFFEGTGPTAATSNSTAAVREQAGCQDTDDNAADFEILAPAPRNRTSPLRECDGDFAPAVTSTTPANAATDVLLDASLTVSFSEPVDATADSFTLNCTTSGDHEITPSGGPTSFTLDPTTDFANSESCTLTVLASAVTDQDTDDPPDNLAADVLVTFTTVAVGGVICSVSPAITPIHNVQGTTDITPCATKVVTVEGVVVGDYEGLSPAMGGFFVQEQDGEIDADELTSEGIFVFSRGLGGDLVALGDVATVTGTASEFFGQTQITATGVTVGAVDQIVTATPVDLPLPSADFLERTEGMLVALPQTLTVTETFQLGRFGEIVVSSGGRLPQPTNVVEPGTEAQELQAANNLNQLTFDDAINAQNVDPIVFGRGGDSLTAENTLRGGDTVTGAVGMMSYAFGSFRLLPVGDLSDTGDVPGGVVPDFEAANPRPTNAPEVRGSLEVGAFNVLNYFLTLDAAPAGCGPTFVLECRGAENAVEFDRQRAKLLAALLELDADVLGLIELENTTGVEPLADIVAGLNEVAGPGTYAYIETGTIGTDAIKVGVIYQPASATPLGDEAILDKTVDLRFNSDLMRPSLAQSFTENATGEVFTIVVNHLKSKSCRGATGADADQGDGQGCWNPTRTAAAEALADWTATQPTGVQDDDVLIVGDLNSYAKEDPIDVLVEAGFVDLAASLIGPDAYSYVFDGQWGYLDYALASPSLVAQVTGAAEYHINADEPGILDYNTNFKTVSQQATLYAPDEFRTSDHDPVLVGLALDGLPGSTVTANPSRLWPPNHKYRTVDVTARSAAGVALTVTIVSVTSSEPDCGGDFGKFCNDIVQLDDDTLRLRSERYSDAGRTYTIVVSVTDGSQTVFETLTIRVANR